jgi:ABC-type proline/glycine betaine transport system permease subunit
MVIIGIGDKPAIIALFWPHCCPLCVTPMRGSARFRHRCWKPRTVSV